MLDLTEKLLDKYYLKNDILDYSKEFIIQSSILIFENCELELGRSSKSYFDKTRLLNISSSTLEHCIRWALSSRGKKSEKDLTKEEIKRLGNEYFNWGWNYSILESFHISTRRGIANVEINKELKTIHFKLIPKQLLHNTLKQKLVSEESTFHILSHLPDSELQNSLKNGLSKEIVDKYLAFFSELILPEVSLDFSFEGYKKSDLIKFWTVIYFIHRKKVLEKRKSGKLSCYCISKDKLINQIKLIVDET